MGTTACDAGLRGALAAAGDGLRRAGARQQRRAALGTAEVERAHAGSPPCRVKQAGSSCPAGNCERNCSHEKQGQRRDREAAPLRRRATCAEIGA